VARDDAPQDGRDGGEVGDEAGRHDVLDGGARPRGAGGVAPVRRQPRVAELLEDLETGAPVPGQLAQVHRGAPAPPSLTLPHERHAPTPFSSRGYGRGPTSTRAPRR